ncbi:serine hydrolase domain-containing protein [Agrilutibacter solisilvae]|uniref:Beta-lactamase family protein n=1 Tax=Agrilutibacter solisilvae TaxID=2763317 RepID=A0A974XZQ2_9GAMM|nr:serine hydrolase domain-containing protein [Lysobacter solisilvae]QSX78756.1 beta-lactamase family protein [Lysobacter solisilvae]
MTWPRLRGRGPAIRRSATWVLAGLLAVLLPPAHAHASPTLHVQVEQALRETGTPGAVWATVDRDGRIHADAAGLRHAPSAARMRVDDKVHVGSVTKTLIATGLLQLASAGRVDLDAPLVRYLPGLVLRNPSPATPVRVRHLLDHTAGLDDMRLWQLFSTRATPDSPLSDAFTRDPSVLALRSRPGARASYSNMGYTLAAMVIESVTGERYEDWLDRELLRPLGMTDSTFHFRTQTRSPSLDTPDVDARVIPSLHDADPRLAWGHLDIHTPAPALPVYLRPAGQFTTTARDLAVFARFLLGDGRVDGRLLVRTDLLRAMGNATTTQAARAGLQAGYALGLRRRDRHGVVGLCHDGSVVGFHAMLCLFPEARGGGRAFVTVQNVDGDGVDTARFDALLIRALDIPFPPPVPAQAAPADVRAWEGYYVPAPNRFAAFAYLDYIFDRSHLSWDGAAFRLAPLQGPVRTLSPAGGRRLVAHDRRTPSHVLMIDADDGRLLGDGMRTWRRVDVRTHGLVAASLVFGLAGLLWFLVVVPVRALVGRERLRAPGVAAAWLLAAPAPAFLLQSYVQLGDRTVASLALYAATAALPALMAWQAWRSLRHRDGLARGRVSLVAALAVLQWCAVLIAWDMLPFALWR